MRTFLCLILMACMAAPVYCEENQMLHAAKYFMNSFGAEKSDVQFQFADKERFNWHFFPKERPSAAFDHMTEGQRKLAHAFVASGLSREGYEKAMQIMYLEQVLYDMSGQDNRKAGDYHIAVFGGPTNDGAWGWRVEGHHLSMNFTLNDGKVVSFSPFFLGANPAEVKEGPFKGMRVLANEEDWARELVNSLNEAQREKAIFAERAPNDILSAAFPFIEPLLDEGIAFSELNTDQRALAFDIIELYANYLKPSVAEAELNEIRAFKTDELYFAWAGGLEKGQGHYYRIQGPTFLIEYDNTQGRANHAHAVWRDPRNDFGVETLRDHYKNSPHHQKIGLSN